MKIDRFVKVMLVVIAVLLALNCATGLRSPVNAQSGAKFGYLHILGPVSGQTPTRRTVSGNQWIFQNNDDDHPVYLGRFNFEALDSVPAKQP